MSQGSGEKTEKATPKRKREERARGNVMKSHDMITAIQLLGCFLVLKIVGSSMGGSLKLLMSETWSSQAAVREPLTILSCKPLAAQVILSGLQIAAPVFIFAIIAAVLGNVLQSGFLLTGKTLAMKGSHINPVNGLKRMFSSRSAMELVKSLAKIAIIIGAIFQQLRTSISSLANLISTGIPAASDMIFSLVAGLALRCGIILLVLAVVDYLYQWWKYEKDLRMTKQEVKDEYKLTEGNPEIKGKIRQIQRMIASRRMMQDVPKADVVITNPTHFAVALRYDPHKDKAPVVLAKGKDLVAARIREIARASGVILVENRPLARSLYAFGAIGRQIPADLYQGVAEVLAYVIRLKEGKKA